MSTKIKALLTSVIALSSTTVWADFNLVKGTQKIICYGEDNQSIEINPKRSAIKYKVEGESLGMKNVINMRTDRQTYVVFKTEDFYVSLSNKGDKFKFVKGENLWQDMDCK